jgi:hypothetical protein
VLNDSTLDPTPSEFSALSVQYEPTIVEPRGIFRDLSFDSSGKPRFECVLDL